MSTIHFDLRPIPHAADEKPKGYFPVVAEKRRTSVNSMLSMIEKGTSLSSADMKGVLEALSKYLCEHLAMGYRVDVPGLGTFSPSLVSDQPITQKNDTQTARHLRIGGISFIPKREVMAHLAGVYFHRTQRPHYRCAMLSDDEAMKRIRKHLDATGKPILTRSAFQQLTGYSRPRTTHHLDHLVQQGLLVEGGNYRGKMYWLTDHADRAAK